MNVVRINIFKPFHLNPKARELIIEWIKGRQGTIPGMHEEVANIESLWGKVPPEWKEGVVTITRWESEDVRNAAFGSPEFADYYQGFMKGWTSNDPEEVTKSIKEKGKYEGFVYRDQTIPDTEVLTSGIVAGMRLSIA